MQSLHNLIATEALSKSSAVFVYDTTATSPFGSDLVKSSTTEVFNMQSRAGAGSALVGFIESIAFTSKGAQLVGEEEEVEVEGEGDKVPAKRVSRSMVNGKKAKTTSVSNASSKSISVLASTGSFLSLVPSLTALPASSLRPAVAIHVSAQASSLKQDKEGSITLEQIPELGSLFEGIQSLEDAGWTGAVILSESAEEGALVGSGLAETVTGAGYDLVNVFDGLNAGRILSNIVATPSVNAIGQSLATILTAAFPYFTYYGSATATQVIVLPASTYSSSAKAAIASLDGSSQDVGILVVRVVKPWNADAFLAALPTSTKTLHLFAEAGAENSAGPFHQEVLSTLLTPPGYKLKIRSFPLPSATLPSVQDWASKILAFTSITELPTLKALLPAAAKLAVFWDLDSTSGETELVPSRLAHAFAQTSTGINAKLDTRFDNFKQGGVQQSVLLLESVGAATKDITVSSIVATSTPSLLFLSSPAAVLKAYAPISTTTIGSETRIVISANWTSEEVATKLPLSARKALVEVSTGTGNLFVVDTDKLAAKYSVKAAEIAEIVFWSLYLPTSISAKEIVTVLANNASFGSWDHAKLVEINSAVRNSIVQVSVEKSWAVEEEMAVDGAVVIEALPTVVFPTSAGPNADRTFVDAVAGVIGTAKTSWHSVAHRLLFPEAFAVEQATEELMRPDLEEKNYILTVSENRRLTPSNYDRNVFHLEFSSAGTGLKYAVGEALGIHGWNDEEEVREFIAWYGLDPEAIISTPSRTDPNGRIEQRTIFQLFQQ